MTSAAERYGIRVGQVYVPADGSKGRLRVEDTTTHAHCDDVEVWDSVQNQVYRIDAFKLAVSRYRLTDESTPEERAALVAKLQAGTATEDEQHRAADLLKVLQDQIRTLEPQAQRGKYLVEHGAWHRREDEQDGLRTWLAVRVPDNSDLSCRPMCERAVDEAIKDPKLR